MNVTKDNFEDVLPSLLGLIPSAKFIAFDEEMTGIFSAGPPNLKKFIDSPQQRYYEMKTIAARYNIIQFGFCLFHDHPTRAGVLEARPFNFYVIPGASKSVGPIVTLEMGAVQFNTQHNMDWQTWITKGIPYVTERDELGLREYLRRDNDNDKAESGFIYGFQKKSHNQDRLSPELEELLNGFKTWYFQAIIEAKTTYDASSKTETESEPEKETKIETESEHNSEMIDDTLQNLPTSLKYVLPQLNGGLRKAFFENVIKFLEDQAEKAKLPSYTAFQEDLRAKNEAKDKKSKKNTEKKKDASSSVDTSSTSTSTSTSTSISSLIDSLNKTETVVILQTTEVSKTETVVATNLDDVSSTSTSTTNELEAETTKQNEVNLDLGLLYEDFAVRLQSSWDWDKESFVLLSTQSLEKQEKAKRAAQREVELNQKVGFRRVYKALLDSKLPMVGHNCFFDILFMTNAFDTALPACLESFRELTAKNLPSIYDTKLLFSSPEFQACLRPEDVTSTTHLGHLFSKFVKQMRSQQDIDVNTLVENDLMSDISDISGKSDTKKNNRYPYYGPTDIVFPEGFDSYSADESRAHEAAYDAYMTGFIFSHIASTLTKTSPSSVVVSGEVTEEVTGEVVEDNHSHNHNHNHVPENDIESDIEKQKTSTLGDRDDATTAFSINLSTEVLEKYKNTIFGMDSFYHHSLRPKSGLTVSDDATVTATGTGTTGTDSNSNPTTDREMVYRPTFPLPGLQVTNCRGYVITAGDDLVYPAADGKSPGATSATPPTLNFLQYQALEEAVLSLFTKDSTVGLGSGHVLKRVNSSPLQYFVKIMGSLEDLESYEVQSPSSQWSVVTIEQYWADSSAFVAPVENEAFMKPKFASREARLAAREQAQAQAQAALTAPTNATTSTTTATTTTTTTRSDQNSSTQGFFTAFAAGAHSFWNTFSATWGKPVSSVQSPSETNENPKKQK